jgi:hypothetical protein
MSQFYDAANKHQEKIRHLFTRISIYVENLNNASSRKFQFKIFVAELERKKETALF